MHPLTKSVPQQRLEICSKCKKRQVYEEKQNNGITTTHLNNENMNETSTIGEETDFYYEKIRFLIVDCRLDTLQKEALLPNSFQL